LAKTKGGAGHLVRKKHTFLGQQKFLADGVAGDPKIWPGGEKLLVWPGSSRICFLNQKQKSYVTLKSVNSKFLKNMVAPPLNLNVRFRRLCIDQKKCQKICIFVNMKEIMVKKVFFHVCKKLYFSILWTGIHVNLKS
jgi:hypothetical protein